jgi:CheY-like chemotaxis protein
VIDQGPGIALENQHKVFNSIVQFDANTLQGGGGSGIGLWVTKKIVDLHGGRVRLESAPGEGSTFVLEIPITNVPTCPTLVAEKYIEPKDGSSNGFGPSGYAAETAAVVPAAVPCSQKVLECLVVDDSALNRKLMVRLLGVIGYRCEEACNGLEAVSKVSHRVSQQGLLRQYDAVCMDKHMPEMDGLQATRQLRQRGYTGLIIGITGDASAEDAAEYREYGADDVLCKPITKTALSSALSKERTEVLRQKTLPLS